MYRKFLSNLGLLIVLNLLIKPLYILGIDAEVQNRVGAEDYGLYFALINLSFLFNIVIDLGINHFNNRNISQNEELIGKHFSKLFSLKAVLSLAYAGVTFVIGYWLGYMHSAPKMMLLLVVNQIFVSFIMFFRSNLTALQFFKSDSLVSILDRGLLIVLGGILLYTNIAHQQFKIEWFVYIQTIAYGFTMLVSFFILRNHIGKLKWSFQPSFVLVIMRRSLPYAMYMLMGMLYNRMDGLMLDNLLEDGDFQAGIYAQGFRYYEAAGMFAILFPVILLPLFSRMLKTNEDIKSLMQISVRLLLGGGILLAVFFWFWSGQVLNWIYDDVPIESVISFRLLMIGFAGLCMFYTYGTLLTANANLKILNIVSFIGLAVNVVLNFILIPVYGVVGAAFATMCTQLFAGGVQMVVASRKFQLGIDKMMVVQLFSFVGLYGGFNYWLIGSYQETTKFALISIAVGTLIYIMVSGLLHPRQIIERFQSKE